MIDVLLIGVGAGAGAALRFLASRRLDGEWPLGTLAVNVAGSVLLGFLVGIGLGDRGLALLGVGFAGGLTTYSAFAVQTQVRIAAHPGRAAAYAGVTVVVSFAGCLVGYLLGQLL
ncbi:fluoride efflux transporter CrcB [Nocardioides salsibiostraticola]